ncbi:MAG: DEAD/DEAH box helicase [Verrucomicrobiales bacterium]
MIDLVLPDSWQIEAIGALQKGQDVVVDAPTGSGKTFVFEKLLETRWAGQYIYTVPTRALANEKFATWKAQKLPVGIQTGDLSVDPHAPLVVATLETQRAKFLQGRGPKLLVLDEYQMLADPQRGLSYEVAVALSPPDTQLLLLSGSVANPEQVIAWLERLGRRSSLIRSRVRPVPLEEFPLEALQSRLPFNPKGFFVQALAQAIQGDMAPILVFCPRRRAAEKLAQDLTAQLPIDQPLSLSSEQEAMLPKDLAAMLKKRIAYHHSGISYAVRAGIIEPLAKAGQLRIVVATTGLAAGINFSLRSVLVTNSAYQADGREQHLEDHQLLQMFGRAGRRGLDTMGYALYGRDSPRLAQAKALTIRRLGEVDWPSFLGAMDHGAAPWPQAKFLATRLFSAQPVHLGVESSLADGPRACGSWVDAHRARLARSVVTEFLNSRGAWESVSPPQKVALGRCSHWDARRLRSALCFAEAADTSSLGTIGRLSGLEERRYGRVMVLAHLLEDDRVKWAPGMTRWFRHRTLIIDEALKSSAFFGVDDAWRGVAETIAQDQGLLVHGFRRHHNTWSVEFALDNLVVEALVDQFGQAIWRPKERKILPESCRDCPQFEECTQRPIIASPAWHWWKLGLIDQEGYLSERGRIVTWFQGGEGLAIAAALEADDYPIEDLIFDLANIRAGHRFAEEYADQSVRLGLVCRQTFDAADIPGYLHFGVPPAYGDGASEVLRGLSLEPGKQHRYLSAELKKGDIERAVLEWRSLLRVCSQLPDHPWPRVSRLRSEAEKRLGHDSNRGVDLNALPPLSAQQQKAHVHRLGRFR